MWCTTKIRNLCLLFPQLMEIPPKLAIELAKPSKDPLQLGPKRIKQLKVTAAHLLPSKGGVLVGLDNGYVGIW